MTLADVNGASQDFCLTDAMPVMVGAPYLASGQQLMTTAYTHTPPPMRSQGCTTVQALLLGPPQARAPLATVDQASQPTLLATNALVSDQAPKRKASDQAAASKKKKTERVYGDDDLRTMLKLLLERKAQQVQRAGVKAVCEDCGFPTAARSLARYAKKVIENEGMH